MARGGKPVKKTSPPPEIDNLRSPAGADERAITARLGSGKTNPGFSRGIGGAAGARVRGKGGC